MFVQIIQAKVKDADGVLKSMDTWTSEVGPKVQGWLGTTAGITPDNRFVAVARFESEELAMKNSDSPEQSKWWESLSKNFDGEATFFNSSGVSLSGDGGSDSAGFVQVMQGKVNSIEKAKEMDALMEQETADQRPDVIGSLTAYQEDGSFYSVIYFTSLEEARQGEKEMTENPPPEMEQWEQLMDTEVKFYDLEEPVLVSP